MIFFLKVASCPISNVEKFWIISNASSEDTLSFLMILLTNSDIILLKQN